MMIIGRLRPDKKSKYGTKSGRPKASRKDRKGTTSAKDQQSSLLESLPTELLQDIFLFSANLNFPLCSKTLLNALTSEHLKFEVTLQLLVYQNYRLSREEKSLLLTRKFFTWNFLVRYVAFAHTRIYITAARSYSEDEVNSDEDEGYAATERSTSMVLSRKLQLEEPPSLHMVDLEMTMLTHAAIHELQTGEVGHTSDQTSLKTQNLYALREKKSIEGLQELDIPAKLLHNGWDDDQVRMLRLLVAFGCTTPRSLAGLASEEGIMEAIAQGDEEMLSHFLSTNIGVQTETAMLREGMKGTNMSIVYQLLFASHGQIDSLDPQIWSLLESNLIWRKNERDLIRRWLQRDTQGPVSDDDVKFLPHMRDIEVDALRWMTPEG